MLSTRGGGVDGARPGDRVLQCKALACNSDRALGYFAQV